MRDRRRDRSRSPAVRETASTKHLSKMLAGFGRYGKSRPPGLRVCSEGSFTLSNLMEVWGRQEGYTRKDILNAVRVHMFHEDQTSLRFSIEQKPQTEDTIIRVLPKRFERSDRAEPRERREGSHARRPSGSRPLASEGPFAETPKSAKDKLAMSLDDVIRSDARGTARASRPGSSTENYQRAQRVSRKAKQMGLTPETQHIREPPLGSADEGMGVAASKTKVRPIAKKAPFPPPSKETAKAKSHAAPKQPTELVMTKTEPEADLEEEEAEAEEDSMDGLPPSGPPGEHWEEYDDNGTKWWYYSGPKGAWCSAGPGKEVIQMDSINLT